MWTPDHEPEHFANGQGTNGYDGDWWKWWLSRGDDRSFIVVKASSHVLGRHGELSERTERAAETRGLSEVERYFGQDVPPRAIELRTGGGEPLVTPRD